MQEDSFKENSSVLSAVDAGSLLHGLVAEFNHRAQVIGLVEAYSKNALLLRRELRGLEGQSEFVANTLVARELSSRLLVELRTAQGDASVQIDELRGQLRLWRENNPDVG